MKRGVERAVIDAEDVVRRPLDVGRDGMTVERAEEQGPQYQHVQRSLEQFDFLGRFRGHVYSFPVMTVGALLSVTVGILLTEFLDGENAKRVGGTDSEFFILNSEFLITMNVGYVSLPSACLRVV